MLFIKKTDISALLEMLFDFRKTISFSSEAKIQTINIKKKQTKFVTKIRTTKFVKKQTKL